MTNDIDGDILSSYRTFVLTLLGVSTTERAILHVDCNKFYASVECLHRPEIRNKPVAVGGDPEQRHGIILTRNEIAAKYGIKTGEALWQAKQKCSDLIIVPPDFSLYLRFSRLARAIFQDYSDQIEPFGIDEAWLDVSGSIRLFGSPENIAEIIRRRVKYELGITVSIGVSWNKVFAKLGSDYQKPDAVTLINKGNYKEIVWPLPVSDLLYVGRATKNKLSRYGIHTIGQLANSDDMFLKGLLGKCGLMLKIFANGMDTSPVSLFESSPIIKSVGNSTTTPRDLETDEDIKMILIVLSESIARRMRELGFKGKVISIQVRDNTLFSFTRQRKLDKYTNLAREIYQLAFRLFQEHYTWRSPVRSIGVSVSDFAHDNLCPQLDFFSDEVKREKLEHLDFALDNLRRRYGYDSIQRAVLLSDPGLTHFNPYEEHIIHPVGYFSSGGKY